MFFSILLSPRILESPAQAYITIYMRDAAARSSASEPQPFVLQNQPPASKPARHADKIRQNGTVFLSTFLSSQYIVF